MTHDPMAEIRSSFFVECEELLESLQDALTLMDEGASDSETINVVFRAVHSIKGGAGAFGLNALVNFAHRFETVLDELRSGRLALTAEAVRLFLQGADLLADQVVAARDGSPEPESAEAVLEALEELTGGASQVEEVVDFAPMGLSFDFGGGGVAGADGAEFSFDAALESGPAQTSDAAFIDALPALPQAQLTCWQITLKPHTGLYQSGNEPAHILRALGQFGDLDVACRVPELPPVTAETAEEAALSWVVSLTSDCTEAELRETFDFVNDVCDIDIVALQAAASARDPAPEDVTCATPEAPADRALPEPPREITPPAPELAPKAKQPANASQKAPSEPAAATVRVDIDKIDRLVNKVGELVINQAMLAQSVAQAGIPSHSPVMNGLEAFMLLTRDIQDSVMAIRAQPVKPLFQRMSRIVREAAASLGKEVRLRTEGEATEVDKTVIERLADPLTHMIRNAVDHGLETIEKRLAAGKSAEGAITLSASHRAGRVLIEIEDDGAGINRPKVREIAVAKGLITADAQLSDQDIDNLLFMPGFSTASQISNLSGRGVGMDVVKSAISALGGRITTTSEPGKGTRFSISLPLTLAVLDGMVVRVADQTMVIPLSTIVETAKLGTEDVKRVGASARLLHIRGKFVPLVDLADALGYRPATVRPESIVLLTQQDDGTRVALIVDAIIEQRQVVIKGLGKNYGRIRGVAAATILGDGQIALILDPADLVDRNQSPRSNPEASIAG